MKDVGIVPGHGGGMGGGGGTVPGSSLVPPSDVDGKMAHRPY